MSLEQLLVTRVMTPNPRDLHIVPGSFALTHFGRLESAGTVTIGINPSVREFCAETTPRTLLSPSKKRVLDREAVGISGDEAPQVGDALSVVASYNKYFETEKHLSWFTQMQKWALDPLGVSYFDGNVAHLDLVQWATDPVWRDLTVSEQTALIQDGSPFLAEQIRIAKPKLVLFNGGKVVETMSENGYFIEAESGVIPGAEPYKYFIGTCGGAKAIGWSINIQSTPDTGNSSKEALKRWLADYAQSTN